jgi:membrane protease YdiL (CAAX protease family)
VAYFGAFGLLAVAPVFPPLGGDDFVLPPGILDDPDMLLWAVAGTWFAFAIAAVLAWGARLTPRDLGLAPLAWGPFLGWTAVLLSALFASATLAELLFGESLRVVEPLTRRPSGLAHWLLWLGLAASAGFCEEFFMRGYGMGLLARAGAPGWVGLTLTSAIFGLLHLYEGPHAVAIIGLWGLLFGVSFQRTGSLLPAMTAHFAVDAVAPLFLRG